MNTQQQLIYDMVVIGGGINGVGIACDAAGRGLSVLLCEKDDLASHTSSASSKLIHGGLRYLEHKEFRLVREALAEREVLLKKAPHIIRPMRFIMPHEPHLRPAWLIRTGLFFYDYLGKREQLAGSNGIEFDVEVSPLAPRFTRGFEYSDCAVDDARLVVLNAIQAREYGAQVLTRTECLNAYSKAGIWQVCLKNAKGLQNVQAKVLVNAAGPWVADFIKQGLKQESPYGIRLIQGSHIIVAKLFEGDKAFIMQNDDHRIVFAIPYLEQYTLIGTTDREYQADPNRVKISQEEIDYLLDVSNDHFKTQLTQTDIISTYSGVRPLCDDESDNPAAVTRDYTLALTDVEGAALLSIFGGKLTTYRKLAEAALDQLKTVFHHRSKPWTADATLPGAENLESIEQLIVEIQQKVRGVSSSLASRWAHAYGTRVWILLNHLTSIDELGQNFGHGLYAQEVDYLVENEWARSSEDILQRRTNLYLQFSASEVDVLDEYLMAIRIKQKAQDVA
ncbi:glycerol-3-phosphate dehydrogenase [Acinetobacter sp. SH20PTE14]|uniref:glycerol-3-phosphate dehydrogenase n=1 Tax=Acinetobacter sp. SH20PTE14 TaxID=2905879 RepID=UPI001F4743E3|nr:glycerol-3-phosphate dehydrogenase [Acinetobacter sp. SH20PTE14]UIJ74909.1 glycerol-3-phosphate dehydrogenase [Acinetobacter sp. SH20PTE14]